MVGISSSMYNAELLEDVRTIAQYAQEQNQPCVINMSLGTIGNPGIVTLGLFSSASRIRHLKIWFLVWNIRFTCFIENVLLWLHWFT